MPMDCNPFVQTVCYANGLGSFCTDWVLCQWTVFLPYGLYTMPMDWISSVRTVYYAYGLGSFCTDCVLCQWIVFLLYGLCIMPMDFIPYVRTVYYAKRLYFFCTDCVLCQWTWFLRFWSSRGTAGLVHSLPMKSQEGLARHQLSMKTMLYNLTTITEQS